MTLVANRLRLGGDDDLVAARPQRITRRPRVVELVAAFPPSHLVDLLRAVDGAAVVIAPDRVRGQLRDAGHRGPIVTDVADTRCHVERWDPDGPLAVDDHRLVAGLRSRRWTPPMSGWWPIETSRANVARAASTIELDRRGPDDLEQLAQAFAAVPLAPWGGVALDLTPTPPGVSLLDRRGYRVVGRLVTDDDRAASTVVPPAAWAADGLELALWTRSTGPFGCDDDLVDLVVATPTSTDLDDLLDDAVLGEVARVMRYEARLVLSLPPSTRRREFRSRAVALLRRNGFHVEHHPPKGLPAVGDPSPLIEARKVSNVRPPSAAGAPNRGPRASLSSLSRTTVRPSSPDHS